MRIGVGPWPSNLGCAPLSALLDMLIITTMLFVVG